MSLQLQISLLGEEGAPRHSIWIPNSKQKILCLRQIVQRRLFPPKRKWSRPKVDQSEETPTLRFFFNGAELHDSYAISDYNLADGNVVQVKIDRKSAEMPPNDDSSLDEASIEPEKFKSPPQPDLTLPQPESSDDFYSPGDHIDALDDATGAWFPATIHTILKGNSYLISFRKPSLGLAVGRSLSQIRPQSHRFLPYHDIVPGQSVLALVENLWFVGVVERTVQDYRHSARLPGGKLWLSLIRGRSGTLLEQHVMKYKQNVILELERNLPKGERDMEMEALIENGCKTKRFYEPDCTSCHDDPATVSCPDCGCMVCTQKDAPEKQLLCDECDRSTHLWCLRTPLDSPPGTEDDDWYCDDCRNESAEELERLQGQKLSDGRSNSAWGFGMSCATTRQGDFDLKKNTIGTFGSIEGVPVGAWWRYRAQTSQAGVHLPLVSGIHGRESLGAYSIVFSGVYEEDVDLGENLYYTATGGRSNASASNQRTSSKLIQDQRLSKGNRALALNCAAPFDGSVGASSAERWRDGRPVRVLRSGNARGVKRSLYQPAVGVRYDGLYKVVKYWAEKSEKSGLVLWRFHLRRDDPSPAPWTEPGRYQARKNGFLVPLYPAGWTPELGGRRKMAIDLKYLAKSKKKQKISAKSTSTLEPETDCFNIPASVLSLIHRDTLNSKQWTELLALAKESKKEVFLTRLTETFTCVCCLEFLSQNPVTLPGCSHSFCRVCLARALGESQLKTCPMCRLTPLEAVLTGSKKAPTIVINTILEKILVELRKFK